MPSMSRISTSWIWIGLFLFASVASVADSQCPAAAPPAGCQALTAHPVPPVVPGGRAGNPPDVVISDCRTVELDLVSEASVHAAFETIRAEVGDPHLVVYNAGYLEGRDLPPDQDLMEHIPTELFDTALHIACRGPFLVAREVLPAMRRAGAGSYLLSNNAASLRGRKRHTGQSLYYPRTMMRALAQALTEEYSEHGVHVANVVIDGLIDSPGTHGLPAAQRNPAAVMDPTQIADAFWYLHTQHPSVWTHELQLTPHVTKPSY